MPVTQTPEPPRAASVELRVEPVAPFSGAVVRFVAAFTSAGLAFDPPHVIWTSRSPSGQEGRGPMVKVAPGVYEFLDAPAVPGAWAYRVEGARGQGVAERDLIVRPSAF